MNALIIFFGLYLLNFKVCAESINHYPKDWYVANIIPLKGEMNVELKNHSKKISKFFKVDLLSLKTMERNDFKAETRAGDGKISYKLNNCLHVDEIYLSHMSLCKSASFFVDGKEYRYEKDEFYSWQKFFDPVQWDEFVIYKNYYPLSRSGDTDKIYDGAFDGVFLINLEEKRIRRDLSNMGGTFTTTLNVDKFNNYLWIGNDFGLYGFDKNFQEKVTCIISLDNKKQFKEFICQASDYLTDTKRDQMSLLIEKYEAVKQGRKPPEDANKRMIEFLKKESLK